VGVTGQQRMLTPPWHLILPLVLVFCLFFEIPVARHSTLYMSVWDYDNV
jgi:ABC-type sugar transport system permease subunit